MQSGQDCTTRLNIYQPTPAPPRDRHRPTRTPQHPSTKARADKHFGALSSSPSPTKPTRSDLAATWLVDTATDISTVEREAEQLASINWLERFPLPEAYQLVPWRADFAANAEKLQVADDLIRAIQSSQLEAQASTALIHHDTLVGWVLVDRTSERNPHQFFICGKRPSRPRPGTVTAYDRLP